MPVVFFEGITLQEGNVSAFTNPAVRALAGVALAAMTCFMMAGCATTERPAAVAERGADVAPDYKIGPGDTISISVWHNPEVSTAVTLRPDGKISTPLVEDLLARSE